MLRHILRQNIIGGKPVCMYICSSFKIFNT
nr:MAG TPA: hypothetical protein [Caudoviricetes sp.]